MTHFIISCFLYFLLPPSIWQSFIYEFFYKQEVTWQNEYREKKKWKNDKEVKQNWCLHLLWILWYFEPNLIFAMTISRWFGILTSSYRDAQKKRLLLRMNVSYFFIPFNARKRLYIFKPRHMATLRKTQAHKKIWKVCDCT